MEPVPAWIEPELHDRLGAAPQRPSWPRVSIVVPTRGRRELLEGLLRGLDAGTDYDAFEVIVLDDGSTDGAMDWLQRSAFAGSLRVIRTGRSSSFSAACNRGAAAADSDHLLFLNDDIEPLDPGWLKRLVTSLDESGAALAGAVLVDPALESAAGRRGAVHHRDLCFRPVARAEGVLEPRPRGFGADLASALGPDRPAVAVSAACALVRRRAFESVQGFCEQFVYGKEDVDLCLKLAAAGHGIVASGSTVLAHRRGATRRSTQVGTRAFQERNLRLLLERWGPRLRREYALDVAAGRGLWSDGPPSDDRWDPGIAYSVVASRAAHADEALALVRDLAASGRRARSWTEGMGWLLDDVLIHLDSGAAPPTTIPGRCNVLVRLDGPRPAKRELARFDIVATGDRDAAQLAAEIEGELERRGGPPRVRRPDVDERPPAPAPVAESRTIFVLGMARTGTSATTRLLNLCGADIGPAEKLMAPNAAVNAKGFYEHFPLMQVNVSLLRRLGGSWRDPPDLSPGWELDPGLDDLRAEARRLIADDFASARLWSFKDPRTCLTLPFWRPLVGEAEFVICHRHPLEVAGSLERRDGLTLEQSLALWERYTAAAIAQTAGARRIFIGYGEYFDRSAVAVDALESFVGTSALTDSAELRAEALTWLSAEMRHHRRTHRELVTEPAVGERVARLSLLLELAVASREREPALAGARGGGPVSDALDAAARQSLGVGEDGAPADGAARSRGLEERIAVEMRELARRGPAVKSPLPRSVRFLFVGGCPRSGTTALTTFLNRDGRFLLGQERYRRVIALLEPFHFSEGLFFNPTLRETSWAMPWRGEAVFPGSFRDYQALRERWHRGGVEVVGDKAPFYHRHLDQLLERFPAARFVMPVRDLRGVARSYIARAENPADHWPAENDHRLAVEHWNEALANARRFLEGPHADRLLLVPYAEFFGGATDQLERLYAFLELELSAAERERYAQLGAEYRRRRGGDGQLAADVEAYLEARGELALEAEVRTLAMR